MRRVLSRHFPELILVREELPGSHVLVIAVVRRNDIQPTLALPPVVGGLICRRTDTRKIEDRGVNPQRVVVGVARRISVVSHMRDHATQSIRLGDLARSQ